MSDQVKEWLKLLRIETSHEERIEVDREIERRTGVYCDEGVKQLTEAEFIKIVVEVQRRLRKKPLTEPLIA